ncbi:magnesium transporter MgtE N-terminal domain-containing protein [Sporosarcina sp. BP05]|uniref:MotE family protein n=1 Tax=Sporosarcina sp. BP05 TaxID=2758726 RepID=UPI0016470916
MKKSKQTEQVSNLEPEGKSNTFQKLFLWVLIPLLFTTALVLIIAKFADVNVFDKAKELTGNLPFTTEKKEEDPIMGDLVLEERVVTMQAEIQEKEAQLFKVQQDLDKSATENEKLLIEQEKLLDEIAVLMRDKDNSKRNFTEIVTTFEQMSAKSSAPVITKMSDAEAIRILTSLKSATLASILEKMTPEDAAKYMTMMTK